MFENLRIAVKRQRKLIIIFLLTLLPPSIALSVFGVRSLRSERFRLTQQLEDEYRRASAYLKNQIDFRFENVEIALMNLAQTPSFKDKNYASIWEALHNRFKDDPLIEFVFLTYRDEEPLFPLFLPVPAGKTPPALSLPDGPQRDRLERAWKMEFNQKNFSGAVVLYEHILSRTEDRDIQALMLNNIGRCYAKLKDFEQAILAYSRICRDYPQSMTSSSLPLDLIARIQIVKCYRNMEEHESFLKSALRLYKDILRRQWSLDADGFGTYASVVEADLSDYLTWEERDPHYDAHAQEFEQLQELRHEVDEQWGVVNEIKNSLLPELQSRFDPDPSAAPHAFRYSRTIGLKDYLVVVSPVLQERTKEDIGLLGVKIDEVILLDQEIHRFLDDFPFSQEASFSVSTLSGRILFEYGNPSSANSPVVTTFKDGFPPWRIVFLSTTPGRASLLDLRRNFHFWTILIFMALGAFLVVRTVAHEMEIIRMKSDFVSSVSHEFKTPITSISLLIERLRQGTVKTPDKMQEYYSIISQETEKLNVLVRNILDYSKVEEGKKQYFFRKTDLAQLVREEIGRFEKRNIDTAIKIETGIAPDIPCLEIDRDAFSLALNNLLENAVKFSPDQKTISVKVGREGENVRIDVEDKGLGIEPGEMDMIFDRFYQGKNTARRSSSGTGLGLPLVKQVMDAHGGKVLVKSLPGRGSTFSLIIPLRAKRG